MDSLRRVRYKIMYALSRRTLYALSRVLFLVFVSLVAAQFEGKHTKITLSWAHKQFTTRLHTLLSMYQYFKMLPSDVPVSYRVVNYGLVVLSMVTIVSDEQSKLRRGISYLETVCPCRICFLRPATWIQNGLHFENKFEITNYVWHLYTRFFFNVLIKNIDSYLII